MTRAQMRRFEHVLREKREQLTHLPVYREEVLLERIPDREEAVQLAAERELAVRRLNRQFVLLQRVQVALDRICEGSFGRCLRCDRPIAVKRLAAVPWARFCVGCQNRLEQRRVPGAVYLAA